MAVRTDTAELLAASDALLIEGAARIDRSRALAVVSHRLASRSVALIADVPRPRLRIRGASEGVGQPTARDRVLQFLRAHSGETWCAACLARPLGLARARVANVFLAAEGLRGFRRHDERCVGCDQRRLGLVCVAQVVSIAGAADSGGAASPAPET